METLPVETPSYPQSPPVDDPPAGNQEPVIDEPGREVPAVDPRVPGQPRRIREPLDDPESPSGPGRAATLRRTLTT
jgi:hypothetical protein